MQATIFAKDLKRIIAATKDFRGNGRIHEYIQLNFSKERSCVTACATDGYRMSVEHCVCGPIDEDFTVYVLPDIPRCRSKNDAAIISLKDGICYIQVENSIAGYQQPTGSFLDYERVLESLTEAQPSFRYGVNGNYLLSALRAAQASCGGLKQPVILEFCGPNDPVVMRTNGNDIKFVLPIRIRQE